MRGFLLMGGLLIGGSGLLAGPASGQERKPPPAPPGEYLGLIPGSTPAMDSLRPGEFAVLQAALGSPASFHLAQPLADAINLSTWITWNEFMSRARWIADATDAQGIRMRARRMKRVRLKNAWHRRILDEPGEVDLLLGDAPNALLGQLSNPKISPSSLRRFGESIPGETIQRISFHYGASDSPISLGRLTVRNGWPLPMLGASFDRERRAYQSTLETTLEQNLKRKLTPEAFQSVQRAVKALRHKLQAASSSLQREDFALAKAFLDNLGDVVESLRQPDVEKLLAGIDSYAGTTVGDLVLFMQRYNLRFSPAMSPDERESYHIPLYRPAPTPR